MRIISAHVTRTVNVGDLASSPCLYSAMPYPVHQMSIMGAADWDGRGHLIIGGGGLLYGGMVDGMRRFLEKAGERKILWGVWHNSHRKIFDGYPSWFSEFDAIGIRDWLAGVGEWVPCASCLNPVFDEQIKPSRELMVYSHYRTPLSVESALKMNNSKSSGKTMENVVREMKASALILTNTYHGMYWAVLACRPCVLVNPFSTRFLKFRFHVPVATKDGWRDAAKDAKCFPDALEICREANRTFHKKVLEIIG